MHVAVRLIGLLVLMVGVALPVLAVSGQSSQFTWYNVPDYSLDPVLSATRCMTAIGSQDLNVTVYVRPGSSTTTGADVNATVYKPQGGTDSITFAHVGSGVYTYDYNFSQTGTYKLVLSARQLNYGNGDENEYVYVQDFNFNIAFSNNQFSVQAGSTGTVQNYVSNSDGNAVNGLSGSIDINYPSGSAFVTDGTISETGGGSYYYSFTAPSTDGVYTVESSFTCGGNTDVNAGGTFTVYGSGGGTGSGTTGSTGSGSSGGSSGGSGGGSSGGVIPSAAKVLDVQFDSSELSIGQSAIPRIVFSNTGKKNSAFLAKVTISQAEEEYYFFTDLTPFLSAGDAGELVLGEPFSPLYGGSHVVRVELYTPDGKVLLDTFSKVFNVDGLLRFDLVATCLEQDVRKGSEASARFNLINLGDYFQDIQFAWWAVSPQGKKVGYGTFPLALYREESRSMVRSITIPQDAEVGVYTFRGQLSINGSVLDGQCSFNVQDDTTFFEGKRDAARIRLDELTQLAALKNLSSDPEISSKLSEARVLIGLLAEAISEKNFAQSQKLSDKVDATFTSISELILQKSTIPLEWLLASIISVLLAIIFVLLGRASVHHVVNVQKHSPRFGHEKLSLHARVVHRVLGVTHPALPHEHGLHPSYEQSSYSSHEKKHDSEHHHSKK